MIGIEQLMASVRLEKYKKTADRASNISNAIREVEGLINGNFPTIRFLSAYEPQEELFKDKEKHGIMHSSRVFILQELLAEILVKKGLKLNREATRFEALLHDVGRPGIPWGNNNHGEKSAEWIEENLRDVVSAESLRTITYAVRWHSSEGRKIPEMPLEFTVLKDADILDREREASLNLNMLYHDVSRTLLLPIARHLLLNSFRIKTQGSSKSDFQCVMRAGIELGIVKAG